MMKALVSIILRFFTGRVNRHSQNPERIAAAVHSEGASPVKRILVAAAALVVCASASVASAQKLNGAGATFPYPIYSKWFSEYSASHMACRSTTSRSAPARASAR